VVKAEMLSRGLTDKVQIVDIDTNPELVRKHYVRSIPTLVMADGSYVQTITGILAAIEAN
jgi:predicted thioredoxin/glutaredoxin